MLSRLFPLLLQQMQKPLQYSLLCAHNGTSILKPSISTVYKLFSYSTFLSVLQEILHRGSEKPDTAWKQIIHKHIQTYGDWKLRFWVVYSDGEYNQKTTIEQVVS